MRAHEDALQQMRTKGGSWAAYQNQALDSANAGHLQFLAVGQDCTYLDPPEQYPADNVHGMGWRYRFIGYVDLETGEINENRSPER